MEMNKIDVLSKLSSGMRDVLKVQNEISKNVFDTTNNSINQLRENYNREREFWNEGGPVMDRTVDMTVKGPHGEIPIRIYYPNDKSTNSGIIYIHGGGFVVGNLDTHSKIMRNLAYYSNCAIIGIDYKLSPEHKFPVAMEECVEVALYFRKNGFSHGINGEKLAFAGDSAGANLCLASALFLRDMYKDNSFIKGLLLYYGMFGLEDSKSHRLYGGPWDGLTKEDLLFYREQYISNLKDSQSPYFNCLEADLTHSIPPCYIVSAEFDPVIDDSQLLYEILKDKGNKVKYHMFEGLIHAFLHHSSMLDEAIDAIKEGAEFMNENL